MRSKQDMTNGKTDRQMEDPITKYPRQTLQAGDIKMLQQI